MGVTLMKVNPVSGYMSMKARMDRRRETGREIPESYLKAFNDFKTMVDKAESFKEKYGLKSNEDVRDAAIKFVLSHPGVHSACPTMNTFDDLETFVSMSGQILKTTDNSMLNDYRATLGHLYCRHACGICESACPHHIPVNTIMRYNHYFMAQGREKHAMIKYAQLMRARADRCHDCSGPCAKACPYNVPIQGLLTLAHENLTLV